MIASLIARIEILRHSFVITFAEERRDTSDVNDKPESQIKIEYRRKRTWEEKETTEEMREAQTIQRQREKNIRARWGKISCSRREKL